MSAELKLTASDRAWLHKMDLAMEFPVAMVAASQYQSVVDSRDAAVRRIFVMRENRRRMWARYKALRRRSRAVEWAAVVMIGGLLIWRW